MSGFPNAFAAKELGGRSPRARISPLLTCAAAAILLCAGCHVFKKAGPGFPGDPAAAYYLNQATRIAYPDVQIPIAQEAFADEPRRLRNERNDEIWNVTLMESLHTALTNSRIVRSSGQFLASGSSLLNHPEAVPSVYDPAIQETGVLYGQRGVEAALAEFDAQLSASMLWGRNERISNNAFITGGVARGGTIQDDSGGFSVGLQKQFVTGGVVNVGHDWDYSYNNSARLFNSVYEGAVRAEFRQPLLAGAGVEYTRIAGPVSEQIQGVTGVGQGVVIARINNDVSLADLEISIAGMLRDVETLYWRLYLAYQVYHSEAAAREAAAAALNRVETLVAVGDLGDADVAAARDMHLRLSDRADAARDSLYATEAELRRMMGLSVNDGRVIRPADDPTRAEVLPDWDTSLLDALARRPELRRQKWSIKSLELQLRAARQLARPRLDFVSSYRVNGFGDDLLGDTQAISDDGTLVTELGSAYDSLAHGDETGWNVGLQFSLPLGLRQARTQIRNYELRLQKARTALAAQEVEISHELAAAFRSLDRHWLAMQTAVDRVDVTRDRLESLQMRFQTEPTRVPVESILTARDALAQAEIELASHITEYNVALADLQYRSGNLLNYNSVHLTEGPWARPAYDDAREHAEGRSRAFGASLLEAMPQPFGI